jgi:ketosteroid isomerase-like protein
MQENQDIEAVQAANLSFYRAFESLDVDRMAEVWAQDASVKCIHPGWPLLHGWDSIFGSWGRIFDTTTMMQFSITEAEVSLEGDWAWVTCTENLTSVVDGSVSQGVVQATNIYRKQEGRWLLVHHQGSPPM